MVRAIRYLSQRKRPLSILLVVFSILALRVFAIHFNTSFITIETALQKGGTQQLFFADANGFNEANSSRERIEKPYLIHRYQVEWDLQSVDAIRLDPADTSGWVKIYECSYKPKGRWRGYPLITQPCTTSGIRKMDYDPATNSWTLTSDFGHTDPYILIEQRSASWACENLLFKQFTALVLLFTLAALAAFALNAAGEWLLNRARTPHAFDFLGNSARNRLIVCLCFGASPIILFVFFLFTREQDDRIHSSLEFEFSGYAPEYIQLDYDLGGGFEDCNSRLFWNKTKTDEQAVVFRIPAPVQDIKGLQLRFDGSCHSASVQNMRIVDPTMDQAQSINLSHHLSASTGVKLNTQAASAILFEGTDAVESRLQLKL